MTKRLVNLYGLEIENNPYGAWLMADDVRMIIFKLVLPTIGLVIVYLYKDYVVSKVLSWVLFVGFIALTIYHIVIYINEVLIWQGF